MVAAGATAATQVPSGVPAAELLASLLSPPVQPVGETREEGEKGGRDKDRRKRREPGPERRGREGSIAGGVGLRGGNGLSGPNAFSRDHSQGEFDRLVVAELGPGTLKHLEGVITKSLAHVHESLLQPGLS